MLAAAPEPSAAERPVGLLAPHAGYRYSGAVAAAGFRCLQGYAIDTVAVIGPMHSAAPGMVLASAHEAYATPLGTVPVDADALEQVDKHLRETLGQGLTRVQRDAEHSIEIQLPFLQRILAHFRLIPLMLRAQTAHVAQAVGNALANVLAGRMEGSVVIASSDLSHYYPQSQAERFDRALLDRVQAFDPAGVLDAADEGVGFACGRGAIAAALHAGRALGATQVRLLAYATSGAVTGDLDAVVGYASALISKT